MEQDILDLKLTTKIKVVTPKWRDYNLKDKPTSHAATVMCMGQSNTSVNSLPKMCILNLIIKEIPQPKLRDTLQGS